ncbi:major pollen allergen Ole e 1-like [Andrographis paniculata]|uniref:major pollen allergen Ole e 1-like n=1 Tax=Andrographis paniculata TaxID=175694 RepID=UPI0021E8433D|nr:major pollen allergen Ole e 1-like [Andrographis paniculata]
MAFATTLVVLLLSLLPIPSSLLQADAAAAATSYSPTKSNPPPSQPQITVMGMVYCDICSSNSFSRHSYFLPGVEVRADCIIKANSPRTEEHISFSVNRTTNRKGTYRFEVPSVDGVQCAARDKAVGISCRATLLSSPSPSCRVPAFHSTSDEILVKSKHANLCIYSLNPLSYRPSKRDVVLCGK